MFKEITLDGAHFAHCALGESSEKYELNLFMSLLNSLKLPNTKLFSFKTG